MQRQAPVAAAAIFCGDGGVALGVEGKTKPLNVEGSGMCLGWRYRFFCL
jgi:hypothetical protein